MTTVADPDAETTRAPDGAGGVGARPAASSTVAANLDTEPGGFTTKQLVALLAITLFAAVLRLWHIDTWAFWVDEAHTFRDITCPIDEFWNKHVARYPLSYLLLRSMSEWFPSYGEGWLRLPFAFFGILSVPLLALFGRSLVGGRAALLAALVLAVDPWHIYWSQNARSYALTMFCALLASIACYHSVRLRSVVLIVLTILLGTLAGLVHPSGYLPLTGFLAFGFVAARQQFGRDSRFAKGLPIAVAVLTVALLPVLIPALEYFQNAKPDTSPVHLVQTLAFFLRVPLIIAALGGAVVLFRSRRLETTFLVCWAFVPLAMLLVVATTLFKVTAQYGFCVLPAFCLLAGALAVRITDGLTAAGWQRVALRVLIPAVLVLDMLAYDVLYFTKQHGDRPRWREAAHHVLHASPARKRIITTNHPGMLYYLRPGHYFGRFSAHVDVVSIEPWTIGDAGGGVSYGQSIVRNALKDGYEPWVVLTVPELEEKDKDGSFDRWLRDHAYQVARMPGWTGPKDMTVLVYRIPAESIEVPELETESGNK